MLGIHPQRQESVSFIFLLLEPSTPSGPYGGNVLEEDRSAEDFLSSTFHLQAPHFSFPPVLLNFLT